MEKDMPLMDQAQLYIDETRHSLNTVRFDRKEDYLQAGVYLVSFFLKRTSDVLTDFAYSNPARAGMIAEYYLKKPCEFEKLPRQMKTFLLSTDPELKAYWDERKQAAKSQKVK